MKINLQANNGAILGYVNLDTNPNQAEIQRGSFKDFQCPDGAVEEIRAVGVLQLIHLTEIEAVIKHWYSKLQKDGVLYVQAFAPEMVCNAFAAYSLPIEHLNAIVFGQNGENCGLYDLVTVVELLKRSGFIIHSSGYTNNLLFVRAIK